MRTNAFLSGKPKIAKVPRRDDDRVILHFDYDCFYASVFENANPSLRSQPLGVKQKAILATCNYVARARGIKKLMLISDAQRLCPDLVLVNGEDLTRFRDVSKKLWTVLRAHAWSRRVERLGLDEVFLDVTDVVKYNQGMLNPNALGQSFFQLDRLDPEKGFSFDGTKFFGHVHPPPDLNIAAVLDHQVAARLMVASHLAGYLRHKLEDEFGYTSSGGIATNKTLAKLAGSVNKPNAQTTLLSYRDESVKSFMDAHQIRKIPGIGSRMAQLIQDHVLSTTTAHNSHDLDEGTKVTVREVRQHPAMSPELLERILDRPGMERGSGTKIWNLLHGVDASEVKEASVIPTQISIEDTWMAQPLNSPGEIQREVRGLATSLVRRMRVDLVDIDPYVDANTAEGQQSTQRWLAYPKTLRLSTRTRARPTTAVPSSVSTSTSTTSGTSSSSEFARTSRSAPLPSFIFSLADPLEPIVERLVTESLLPLFRRIHSERQGWNLVLLNICVTNMVEVAAAGGDGSGKGGGGGGGGGVGRDISRMFRTQEYKLREWTVYDTTSPEPPIPVPVPLPHNKGGKETLKKLEPEPELPEQQTVSLDSSEPEAWNDDGDDGDDGSQQCPVCGHAMPAFAMLAHERFHAMGD